MFIGFHSLIIFPKCSILDALQWSDTALNLFRLSLLTENYASYEEIEIQQLKLICVVMFLAYFMV